MAKFTSSIPLNMSYEGHYLAGPAGTEFRIPDSLRAAFDAEFGARVRPVWTVEDEIGTGGGAHPNVATHVALGLVSSAHETVGDPHVQYALDADLANHEADTTSIHGIANTANLSLVGHSHVDADIPASIARDSEVSAAISSHESTATHGGGSLPSGIIVMWGGAVSAIPSGWLLCNGANGTPDLRSRFVKGAAAGSDPGATGGAATHTHAGHSDHTVTQPSAHIDHASHSHAYTQVVNHVHVENINTAITGGLVGFPALADTSTSGSQATGLSTANPTGGVASGLTAGPGAALTHDAHTGTAVNAHSAHDSPNSEPAYYALAFIQKS